jgi:hypothetical protein
MKLICATCNRLKDEEEFDWWFKSIRVRKRECREYERKNWIRWMLKELEKQKKRK